jgi:transposase
VREIWRAAPGSIGCRMGATVEFEARVMIDGLKQIRATMRSVEEKIEELCLPFPEYSYLLSMPGFGPNVSSMVLGAIGNPHRFTSCKQVLKMAGYDLCANRSGKTSKSATPVISKQGKAELRHALYQAAMVASTKSKDFIIYYSNKLKGREREKGIRTKMRVKLAAKMLIIAWTLMKKGEFFNPDYLNKG